MKASKHTPGPWNWDADGYLWANSEPRFEVANGGTVYRNEDARLIAAAPELYQACVEALEELIDMPGISSSLMVLLITAIDKAEGED